MLQKVCSKKLNSCFLSLQNIKSMFFEFFEACEKKNHGFWAFLSLQKIKFIFFQFFKSISRKKLNACLSSFRLAQKIKSMFSLAFSSLQRIKCIFLSFSSLQKKWIHVFWSFLSLQKIKSTFLKLFEACTKK